ncbi:MAG: 50S ribosomal protein L18 [Bacillota bacterium]|nr:50S ribosomal protein L18 [Bacillota bacterium]
MLIKKKKSEARIRRHLRVRKTVTGTEEKPRLCVFRSLKHVYAQVIRDDTGETLASASSVDVEIRTNHKHGGNVQAAEAVGELVARRALEKGVRQVVFDRGGYLYHGRVAALAKAAREAGLDF